MAVVVNLQGERKSPRPSLTALTTLVGGDLLHVNELIVRRMQGRGPGNRVPRASTASPKPYRASPSSGISLRDAWNSETAPTASPVKSRMDPARL